MEGLCCAVVSKLLAHVLLGKGSGFQLSHGCSNLLLTKIIYCLDGWKILNFFKRQEYSSYCKDFQWQETFTTNCIERPLKLEHVSVKDVQENKV